MTRAWFLHRGGPEIPLAYRRLTACLCLVVGLSLSGARGLRAQSTDPFEGLIVRAINVTGGREGSAAIVARHLATRVGEPFRRETLGMDRRQLGELRLFSSVTVEPRLEQDGVAIDVVIAETLRILPVVLIRVTDENGVSAGPGVRALNLLGYGAQSGAFARFGGETAFGGSLDSTTITPGTTFWHFGLSDTSRHNPVYDFDEDATTTEMRIARNWAHGLRTGIAGDLTIIDTGASGASLSADGSDVIPTIGAFVTYDRLDSSIDPRSGTWAEFQVDRLLGDARSWTFTLDGRRFQPLSERHGIGLFSLAAFQTGQVSVDLPEYMQYALGGGNSVRGWSLASRRGRNQFIGSVEYTYVVQPVTAFSVARVNLYGGIQVVGFADVGLAWNDGSEAIARSAIDGYGLGVRFLVPFVDVIRVDLAWGEPGEGASAYFGVSLKATRQRQRVR